MSLIFAKSWPSVPYLLSLTKHNECTAAAAAAAGGSKQAGERPKIVDCTLACFTSTIDAGEISKKSLQSCFSLYLILGLCSGQYKIVIILDNCLRVMYLLCVHAENWRANSHIIRFLSQGSQSQNLIKTLFTKRSGVGSFSRSCPSRETRVVGGHLEKKNLWFGRSRNGEIIEKGDG